MTRDDLVRRLRDEADWMERHVTGSRGRAVRFMREAAAALAAPPAAPPDGELASAAERVTRIVERMEQGTDANKEPARPLAFYYTAEDMIALSRLVRAVQATPAAPPAAGAPPACPQCHATNRVWSVGDGRYRCGACDILWGAPTPPASCIGSDPLCPCQDGDACRYRNTATTRGWPIPAPVTPVAEGVVCRNHAQDLRDAGILLGPQHVAPPAAGAPPTGWPDSNNPVRWEANRDVGHMTRDDLVRRLVDLQREIGSTANGAHCYGVWARRIGEMIAALAAPPAAPLANLAARLRKFVTEYRKMGRLDPEQVYALHSEHEERFAPLLLSDLDAAAAALAAPPAAPLANLVADCHGCGGAGRVLPSLREAREAWRETE